MTNKTYNLKPAEINRKWHLLDLSGKNLGRTATDIAGLLMGKMKVNYTPQVDNGDFVVAINASKIQVSGKKSTQKLYRHHTGYPGGFRQETYLSALKRNPAKIVSHAVSGMIPDNKLKDQRLLRLKVYPSEVHPYQEKVAK